MTDHNREELIDGLVEVLIEMTSYTNRSIDEITADPNQVTYGDWAERLITVFEQAHTLTEHECTWACWVDRYGQDHHTPTSDEREALAALARGI